ncbi:response regulator [Anaerotruncus rubiinfantis]|uniref:response regulator n=1 Tax=Anaerotruncus rubiinfantis TaxID=1720200 RepID=UPI0008331B30|nr:response regulator [Anaerotruncus rubiinfantis]
MYTLFIVDDREIFRRQFKRFRIFQDNSRFQVRFEAQNGQEALEILRREQVDIMITDIRMPVMDGLELLKKAREEALCPCIILLSEYADFAYAKQGIVLGAFDYVVKPINQDTLTELLDRCAAHLASLAQGAGYDNNALRILPSLILKNDDYSATISRQIAGRVCSLEGEEPEKAWASLESVLTEIRQQVLKTQPHMEDYCDFDALFSLDKTAAPEKMADSFCGKVAEIQKEINKFSVSTKSELIQSVCNTVVKNIENNLSLQGVADLHFVNKAYLSHLFKQELGMSFVDYLTMVKIERAKILLGRSNLKIYEISARLGYSDTEYFSRVFKQFTGLTSTEYRQLCSNGEEDA